MQSAQFGESLVAGGCGGCTVTRPHVLVLLLRSSLCTRFGPTWTWSSGVRDPPGRQQPPPRQPSPCSARGISHPGLFVRFLLCQGRGSSAPFHQRRAVNRPESTRHGQACERRGSKQPGAELDLTPANLQLPGGKPIAQALPHTPSPKQPLNHRSFVCETEGTFLTNRLGFGRSVASPGF